MEENNSEQITQNLTHIDIAFPILYQHMSLEAARSSCDIEDAGVSLKVSMLWHGSNVASEISHIHRVAYVCCVFGWNIMF